VVVALVATADPREWAWRCVCGCAGTVSYATNPTAQAVAHSNQNLALPFDSL